MNEEIRIDPNFENLLDEDEKIIWQKKPIFIPFIATGLLFGISSILFAIVWVCGTYNSTNEDGSKMPEYFWLFGLFGVASAFFAFLNKLLSYKNTNYAYTTKRVMIKSGFWGIDMRIIDFDKIGDIEVKVTMLDDYFGTGTIKFYTGRSDSEGDKVYEHWYGIENPYAVLKELKKVAVDIKTDFNYPNALRPETNPGYRTKYEPE